jgi:hypothetical protein
MEFSKIGNFFVVLVIVAVLTAGAFFVLQNNKVFFGGQTAAISNNQNNILTSNSDARRNNASEVPLSLPPPPQKLSNPPKIIKAVYITGWSAGTRKYLDYLSNLFKATEINAVVVDIKGSSGFVSYASGAEQVKKYNLNNNTISDIDALVRFFHDQDIYVIGRIAVFEDPIYSKARPELAVYNKEKTTDLSQPASPEPSRRVLWQDNNKLSWLDPASKDVWDYNISLAKDAFEHGFDEINFDYIRFPTDGNAENMGFPVWDEKTPMQEVIKGFFQY